jgi:hypothetical protein
VIDQASCRICENRKDLAERCAHGIRDYIPLTEIWLEFRGSLRYKTAK